MAGLWWSSAEQMVAETALGALAASASHGGEIRLAIDGVDEADVRVVAMRGVEGMNRLYRFDAVVAAGLDVRELRAAALGRRVTITMATPGGGARVVHGIASRVTLHAAAAGRGAYHVQIVPKAWLLTRRRDSRVFTDATVREVVSEVLLGHGVANAWSLARPGDRKEYCLQVDETDWEFVTRLLGEAGIFFSFEHPASADEARELMLGPRGGGGPPLAMGLVEEGIDLARGGVSAGGLLDAAQRIAQPASLLQMLELSGPSEVLVLGDSPAAYARLAGGAVLHHRPRADSALEAGDDHLAAWSVEGRIEPTRSTVRGYDFTRAARPAAGTVLGMTSGAGGGLVGDAASAGLGAIGNLAGAAGSALGAAGEHTNVVSSHGVTTATHAEMPPEVALGRAGIAVGTAALQQVFGDAGVRDALGAAGAAGQGLVGGSEEALEIYEHHGDHEELDATFARSVARLEQHRAEAFVARGLSYCRRLTPGHVFDLVDHAVDDVNRGWVVIEVVHEATASPRPGAPIYQNELACVPATTPYRPARPRRKVHHVVETAVVVGPSGSEIATEAYGRVKIQFHWDRLRKHDERSSCWVRVAQPWSGPGYGFQFVPRIGAEVLVSFLGGDVDRPVVVGCLPNLANPVPYALPQRETQSGIRTQSTPRSEGYSEIMLDDAAGAELVHIRAERDLTEEIRHDHATTVGRERRLDVRGDARVNVEGDRAVVVGGAATLTVEGDRRERTERDAIRSVGGHDIAHVRAGQQVQVDGDRVEEVRGSASVVVGGAHDVTVGGDAMLTVGSTEQPSNVTVAVGGAHTTTAADVTVSARGRVVIVCGGSVVTVRQDDVQIRARKIAIRAEEAISLATDAGAGLEITDGVEIFGSKVVALSQGGVLRLTGDADLGGGEVHLGSGDSAASSRPADDAPETQPLAIQLTDAARAPHANRRFRLVAGEQEIAGSTDGDGWVRERIARGLSQANLTLWTGEYPGGPRRTWSIAIGDVPDAASPDGARARLANLGYAPGAAGDEAPEGGLDASTRAAVRRFQRDHGVTETGELDQATVSALRDASHA